FLAERAVDARRRLGEEFGAALGHVPAILEPHPEFARNVEAGLVGKAHSGREWRGLAVDQIDRLVNLHADAVPGAVRQAGQTVAGPESPAFIDLADGVIDGTCGHADLGGFDRNL